MQVVENGLLYERGVVVTQTQEAPVSALIGPAYQTVLGFNEASGVIFARYLDYEGNPVDFNGDIIFKFEGEQQTVQAVNGVAEISFAVIDPGTYIVRTANADIENGEVTINA